MRYLLRNDYSFRLELSLNIRISIFLCLLISLFFAAKAKTDETDLQTHNILSRKAIVWEYPDQKIDCKLISIKSTGVEISETEVQGEENKRFIPFNDLVRISFKNKKQNNLHPANLSLILLENGDRIFASIEKIENDYIFIKWNMQDKLLQIPLETVRAILFHYSRQDKISRKLLSKVFQADQQNDYYYLVNGDTVSGELKSMDSSAVSLESRSGLRSILRNQIAAIIMNRELISFPETKLVHQLVQFQNGSWLNCHTIDTDKSNQIQFETIAGMKFSTGFEAVKSITFLSSRVQFLSALKQVQYQHVPYLSQHRDLKVNRNNHDLFLQLGDVEFPTGLGMYSQSSVTYQLSGQFQRLHASLGIDQSAGKYGSVLFSVEADRRKIYESPQITRATSPVDIKELILDHCNELKLNVHFGEFGDIQDLANWCDLLLIK